MSSPRFFVDTSLTTGTDVRIEGNPAHHMARVLRMRPGDQVRLFNGDGNEYTGHITHLDKRHVAVHIDTREDVRRESPLHTTLGLVLSKGDRFDWALQKATELGVSAIQPLTSQRCEVRLSPERLEKKMPHWQQVLISACEQCGRNRVPVLHPVQSLGSWVSAVSADRKLVLAPGMTGSPLDGPVPHSAALLIGPEGGLSDNEIQQARDEGFEPVTFGPRIWRTETAPVAALAILQWQWGDFRPRQGE